MTLRKFLATVGLLSMFGLGVAGAEDYPSQTIKVIVPFTPGGPVDALSRVVVQQLQARLGQNVIIENRSGGGTSIGAKYVAASPPDGYTLMVVGPNIAYYPALLPNLDFDPGKALAPIATLVTWSHVLAVAPSLPAKTLGELVSYAKAQPGKLAFGFGLGTMPQIIGEEFIHAAGVDITRVPYRGGEQARSDILGGRVHINIAPSGQLLALIQDSKLRALAYTGTQRSAELPNVPTMTESGYPQVGFHPDVWMGVFAPAGTPAPIVERLNREINAVMQSDEIKPALKRFGYDAKITTPAEFAVFFASELKKWPAVLKATGIKPQ